MTEVMAWRLGAGWYEHPAPVLNEDEDDWEDDDDWDEDDWDDDDEDWDEDWDDDDWDEEEDGEEAEDAAL